MGTINKQTKLPNVYFCYDTITERYVTGAKGQYTFDSTGGLGRSMGQQLSYSSGWKAYEFLKAHGYEPAMTDHYEMLLKEDERVRQLGDWTLSKPIQDNINDHEEDMRNLVGFNRYGRCAVSSSSKAKYADEARKWKYSFKTQSRYEVHTIDTAVATVVK